VHGLVASANKSAYVAAKHGLVGLTKAVALEQANSGVTVNAIAPGWVLTPLVQAQIDARAKASGQSVQVEKEKLLGEKQPMYEFSTVEGLGSLAVFLCQPEAKSITGTTITMDGGWTAQ
jgi:3-hydroxybutyrate dehydrogenase